MVLLIYTQDTITDLGTRYFYYLVPKFLRSVNFSVPCILVQILLTRCWPREAHGTKYVANQIAYWIELQSMMKLDRVQIPQPTTVNVSRWFHLILSVIVYILI